MKKLLLTMLMLMVTTTASAEWTISGFSDSFIQYVDRATIRRNGNFVKMWNLRDYMAMQTIADVSYFSSKRQLEYDCKEERSRRLAVSFFSGRMGNGNVVLNDNEPDKWGPIQPESIGEALWKVACGKK